MHAYSTERGPYEDVTYWTPTWALLNGGVTTTLGDMGKWARALGTGTLLSRDADAGDPDPRQRLTGAGFCGPPAAWTRGLAENTTTAIKEATALAFVAG